MTGDERPIEDELRSSLHRLARQADRGSRSPSVGEAPSRRVTDAAAQRRATSRWLVAAAAVIVVCGAALFAARSQSPSTTLSSADGPVTPPSGAALDDEAPDECEPTTPEAADQPAEPSPEDMSDLTDPDARVGVEDAEGRLRGYVLNRDIAPQAGESAEEAIARLNSLVEVRDLCDVKVGWLAVDGSVFFTLDEVEAPGFDVRAEVERRLAEHTASAAPSS